MKKSSKVHLSGLQELDEIIIKSQERTVINDHLSSLFIESLRTNPKLIVELGVETGQSTFALERVARLCNSKLVSVDLEDCSNACQWEDWIFIKKDDLEFSKMFISWCKKNDIIPEIDILFIDTDHHYEQTIKEIRQWFPYLSKKAKGFFHDSNVKPVYRRKDGSIGTAPDYQRGVIRLPARKSICLSPDERAGQEPSCGLAFAGTPLPWARQALLPLARQRNPFPWPG